MPSKFIIYIFLALLASAHLFMAYNLFYKKKSDIKPAVIANPFTRIGGMATQNGMLVEVYVLDHPKTKCTIAVQQVPNEIGRASIVMQCDQ